MIDLVLLRLMKYRKDFMQLYGIVQKSPATDDKTKALLADYKKYFDAYPSHDRIDLATFFPRFKAWHPTLNAEQLSSYEKTMVAALTQEADEDQRTNVVAWLADVELFTRLANAVEDFNNGDLIDSFGTINRMVDEYRQRLGIKFVNYIDTPIEELLMKEFEDTGVSWRLGCLNQSMRKLRPGDFGIIAGRPDKGKTSFIASEITFMAPQLPKDKNIIWLNNEGPGDRIIPRLYQAAFGVKMEELKALSMQGNLSERYAQLMGGRKDKIRIFDIHGFTNGQVEMILEDNNPGIIVYDMIDNIKGFGDAARTDLALEQMYQWARERSVKYDAVGLATSQISNDGDGLQFPTLGMLKDSKTGKQGACDFQLMIGASNDPAFNNSRFIGLPKNKLRRPDGPSDPRAEVIFDGQRSRYRDVPIGANITEHAEDTAESGGQTGNPETTVSDDELDAFLGD